MRYLLTNLGTILKMSVIKPKRKSVKDVRDLEEYRIMHQLSRQRKIRKIKENRWQKATRFIKKLEK